MGEVTELLKRVRQNDRAALDELVALMYPDLHRMAGNRLAQNDTITLLDTTSMVHEVYLRLRNTGRIDAESRRQFIVYAAQVLHSVSGSQAPLRGTLHAEGREANSPPLLSERKLRTSPCLPLPLFSPRCCRF